MGFIKYFYKSNRHIKLAIIVAPLLAIGAYVLTGVYLDDALDTQEGSSKPLHLQPGCRLLSNVCELLHRDIAVNIAIEEQDGQQLFYLSTSTPIKGALVGFGEGQPESMLSRGSLKKWVIELKRNALPGSNAQLVLSTDKHQYYAEFPVAK